MANKPYQLIALGRLPAATRDGMGDTLGSFSGLALEPGSWRAVKGGYGGVFAALPDRGFNIPEENRFSNYATRVHRIGFELKGDGLSLSLLDTRYLRDERGALTTGLDPGNGSTKQFGVRLPSPATGPAAGRLSIDSEGIAIGPDGRLFVSDEFGPNIYCFAPDGRMMGVITPPEAFVPALEGEVCFSSLNVEPARGRAPNDGFEGLSLSPDGGELYALLQSPLMQDRRGKAHERRYTRLLVYDVSTPRLPRKPKAHYAVELPLHSDGDIAEANEIVDLGFGQVLVLTRESFGFGAKERNRHKAIAHKQVMTGSLEGVSDLSGSKYERKAKSILNDDGELDDGIVPMRLTPFVDIADEDELNRVKLSARAGRRGFQLLSAKWESIVLSPALTVKKPRERLMFVGNDNDFRTRSGFMPEGAYDGGIEHDNMILAYRVTLPE
jgi:hypothetical protein